jgi:tRNA threonylcarbamoyladenosine biosynthesis protein TsaE
MSAVNTLRAWQGLDELSVATLAGRLAGLLRGGDWLLLHGALGAGKTSFARAVLRMLGHAGDVPSPTFTLIQVYDAAAMRLPVWHADLYRLDSAAAVAQLGLDDAGDDLLVLLEWPDRLGHRPDHALQIDFSVDDEYHRTLTFSGTATWQTRLKDL